MFPEETHILVIDDSSNIRQVISSSLERIGFRRIETAVDAHSGFEKIQKKNLSGDGYHLILSDLNMPGPSGIELLKQLRNSTEYSEIPFILITTESEKGAVLEAAMSGVSSYIVKPFDLETVKRKLKEAWGKHGSKYQHTVKSKT